MELSGKVNPKEVKRLADREPGILLDQTDRHGQGTKVAKDLLCQGKNEKLE